MTPAAGEFIRRFLLHVLPTGLHRIRHYGLLANNGRKENLALARQLLQVPGAPAADSDHAEAPAPPTFVCRHCGAPMCLPHGHSCGRYLDSRFFRNPNSFRPVTWHRNSVSPYAAACNVKSTWIASKGKTKPSATRSKTPACSNA